MSRASLRQRVVSATARFTAKATIHEFNAHDAWTLFTVNNQFNVARSRVTLEAIDPSEETENAPLEENLARSSPIDSSCRSWQSKVMSSLVNWTPGLAPSSIEWRSCFPGVIDRGNERTNQTDSDTYSDEYALLAVTMGIDSSQCAHILTSSC